LGLVIKECQFNLNTFFNLVCRCGPLSLRSGTKVVGGAKVMKGEVPWQVALTTREEEDEI
jgi:hypothetical protein